MAADLRISQKQTVTVTRSHPALTCGNGGAAERPPKPVPARRKPLAQPSDLREITQITPRSHRCDDCDPPTGGITGHHSHHTHLAPPAHITAAALACPPGSHERKTLLCVAVALRTTRTPKAAIKALRQWGRIPAIVNAAIEYIEEHAHE